MNFHDPQLPCAVTDTDALGSFSPSLGHRHAHHCVHTHTLTLLGTQALTRIGCTEELSGLQCSHARLLADRDKPLFHSLTHPHRYTHMQALGKPQWCDIKEHAPLPVKLYCIQARSHTSTHAQWAPLHGLCWPYSKHRLLIVSSVNIRVYYIHDWRRPLLSSPHNKVQTHPPSASNSYLIPWSDSSWKYCQKTYLSYFLFLVTFRAATDDYFHESAQYFLN